MQITTKSIEKHLADEWAYSPEELVEIGALDLCKLLKDRIYLQREVNRLNSRVEMQACFIKTNRTIITL